MLLAKYTSKLFHFLVFDSKNWIGQARSLYEAFLFISKDPYRAYDHALWVTISQSADREHYVGAEIGGGNAVNGPLHVTGSNATNGYQCPGQRSRMPRTLRQPIR